MTASSTRVKRPLWVDVTILLLSSALFLSMVALGNWQVRRLGEKLDLITRVETYAYGDPVPAPMEGVPPEYLRVHLSGTYDHTKSILIKAVTDLGPGYWMMTPLLVTDAADTAVWINRGFVPTGTADTDWSLPEGSQEIVGLVRPSQPEGTLLESNLPEQNRWVSPDLSVMSTTVGLRTTLDYYVAAEHSGVETAWPRGGMTRLKFSNSHLSYALTWYAMAALFLAAMLYVIWDRKRANI
ncbi:SURF1 family protein [Shimia sp. R9_1]|uniref:SURF1 family protein n=1 Tax=Shimia sp. R9_1 TaxID=2821111 RepID=UPI001ADBD52E|nr:SURF1 family cytochrome oxidase biogenesis protein [Shimia sp. R9_1]MBO9405802.1 SURF1 family protein [Shimia sp. R9_1]